MNKADKAMLIIVIIIAVLVAGYFISKQGFKALSVAGTTAESQLKQECTTYWADETDAQFCSGGGCPPELAINDKFIVTHGSGSGGVKTGDGVISLSVGGSLTI